MGLFFVFDFLGGGGCLGGEEQCSSLGHNTIKRPQNLAGSA